MCAQTTQEYPMRQKKMIKGLKINYTNEDNGKTAYIASKEKEVKKKPSFAWTFFRSFDLIATQSLQKGNAFVIRYDFVSSFFKLASAFFSSLHTFDSVCVCAVIVFLGVMHSLLVQYYLISIFTGLTREPTKKNNNIKSVFFFHL